MIFSLEALNAGRGDALVLHYGTSTKPRLALIDGGLGKTYSNVLLPRLDEVRANLGLGDVDPLPLEFLAVSHIDDDHVNGMAKFLAHLADDSESAGLLAYDPRQLWHNGWSEFDGALQVASLRARATQLGGKGYKSVAAGVATAVELQKAAARINVRRHAGYPSLITAGTKLLAPPLKITVTGPTAEQVDALKAAFAEKLQTVTASNAASVAKYVDDSVHNLSSIVLHVKHGTKSMLLTGDARGDHVLEGLAKRKLLKPGQTLHVDVLKLPHHGSDRNLPDSPPAPSEAAGDFFRRITADHYVISADDNKRYHNPDEAVLERLTEERKGDDYVVYLTNPVPWAVEYLRKRRKQKGHTFDVNVRKPKALGVRVDLLDKVTW